MPLAIPVRSPWDGAVVGEVRECSAADVDVAVKESAAVLVADALPAWRRAEVLERASHLLAERVDDFARTIASEAAKPLVTAVVEAQRAATTFRFAAVAARTLAGEVVPLDAAAAGEGKVGFTFRVPVGVVGGITPFNFPLNLVAHKVAPAIAAGCPLVLKPAPQTPLSAGRLRDLLVEECGLPAGWLHVLTGPGPELGAAVVAHDAIPHISFTGSGRVGWAIRQQAPRKRVALELGNNTPVVVEPDGDWEGAAAKIAVAGFAHAGQSCVSVQRVYVQEQIAGRFLAALVPRVEALRVGDPLDPSTEVSCLINTASRDRVRSWIEEAVGAGARVLCGNRIEDGVLYPTVLSGVTADMRVSREEVFGPVVAVQAYRHFDEGLALADDTDYGLQAGVFTADLAKAITAARRLRFGTVLVNEVPTWRADHMPYGGVRGSGNTKEGPLYAARDMTEERLVVVQP